MDEQAKIAGDNTARNDFVVNFLREDGAVGSADCKRLLRDMKKQVPETRTALGDVEFGDKKKPAGLQAADALAFAACKLMPTNPQMIDVPEGDTFYHCRLDAAMLGALKSDILTMVELRKRYAAEIAASRQAAE